MPYAPITLFTYCRADKTQLAVESLLRNADAKDTDLFIFSDGPKVYPDDEKKTEEKRKGVEENRRYIHTITGFKSVSIVERNKNWGLANSLIAGITDVISRYGRIIVVEDDLVLSPYFLRFMNDALEKYKDDDRVSTISAFVPRTAEKLPETYFLTFFQCWGWATWERGWKLFNHDIKYLLRKMRFKTYRFNLDGSVGSYGNLYCQKVGLVDSWYLPFYASLFLKGKLTLFPGHSMASNVGLDGTGTHCGIENRDGSDQVVAYNSPIILSDIPVEENKKARQIQRRAYAQNITKRNPLRSRYLQFKSFVRRLLYIDCM